MSEKRFTLDDEENGLCRCILVDGEEMPTCEICELLNNLHQENQQLKHYKVYGDNKRLQTIIVDLKKENEQLRQTMQKVCELLEEEVDLFSDKATEHDVIAYCEMRDFDNKDAYYICTATKKAIQMLKGRDSDE